ncbi:hypothetical protein [Baaleninema simplex]|uniref:hypothetical protein n=1 Tax=Baaleninema simplex TaxID=2862350 RepID=UPI00037FC0E5|nr:hypothetical protein [Baaleninema simplex]
MIRYLSKWFGYILAIGTLFVVLFTSKSNPFQMLLKKNHSAFAVRENQEEISRKVDKPDREEQLANNQTQPIPYDNTDSLQEYYFFRRSGYQRDWSNILIDSDGVSFPYIGIVDTSGGEVQVNVRRRVIRLIYRVVHLNFGKIISDDLVLETKIDFIGTFGLLSEETVRDNRLPSRVCIINMFYLLGRTTSMGNNQLQFFFRASERVGLNPNHPQNTVPAIDWQVVGNLVSESGDFAQFQFDATTTHEPHFYASNFEINSRSEMIEVKPIIEPGHNITIVIQKIIRDDNHFLSNRGEILLEKDS